MFNLASGSGGSLIKIATWNILGQCNIRREMFPYTENIARKWSHRKKLLVAKIKELDADVLCLQEVDDDYPVDPKNPLYNYAKNYGSDKSLFRNFWNDTLDKLGYDAVHVRRTGGQHGCMIAWRKSKLQMIESWSVNLDKGSAEILPTTGNIACVVKLQHLKSKVSFLTATTHLYWRPDAASIRVRQALNLREFLDRLSNDLDVFCCGDFNFEPSDGEYSVLCGHQMSQEMIQKLHETPESWNIDEINQTIASVLEKHAKFTPWKSIFSCYSIFDPQHELSVSLKKDPWFNEPRWTNYTEKFKGTLDYMFMVATKYSKVLQIFQLPRVETIQELLPNVSEPSDHLPLLATFELNKNIE